MGPAPEGHQSVLLEEAVKLLAIQAGGTYVDGTFGRGGHSENILAALGPQGHLLAIDKDPSAIVVAEGIARRDARLSAAHGSFGKLREILMARGIFGEINGVLLDLGVSSPQLDSAERGFSFMQDGPLDMRMNPDEPLTAADWIADASEKDIARVLYRLGEEESSRRIARAIVERRAEQSIQTTSELAGLIEAVIPRRGKAKHPATKTFQAIRIFVNHELEELESCLQDIIDALVVGGRLCVISFHSLEDRIVKRFMRDNSRVDPALASLPEVPASARPRLKLCGKAVRPSAEELTRNPRARSAVLRVAERIA
ncbi:MAG: 16S rRNA (cytosine(1402)-N(4))-methyltransferase RsmH [Gammaproteobacteria bacterium]